MFDREKWVDALGQIDEKYMVEYYERKLGRKTNKKNRDSCRYGSGLQE